MMVYIIIASPLDSKLNKDMMLTKAQLQNERKIQQLQMQAINALWKKVSTMQVDSRAGGEQGPNLLLNNCTSSEDAIGSNDVSQSQASQGQLCLDQNSTAVVNDLAKRCTMLTDQVQQLQSSIGTIVNCLTMVCNLPQDALKKQINSEPEESECSTTEPRDSSATQTDLIAVHTPQLEDLSNFPFTKPRPSTLALESTHDALDTPKIQTEQQQQQLAETEHDELKENIEICDAVEQQ